MCQAYDGERAYLVAQERLERERQSARLSLFDEMREALEKHKAFFDRLTEHFFDDCTLDLDGGDFQKWGVECGLLRAEAYDPEKHSPNSVDAEPGDTWYVPTGVAKAVLAKLSAMEERHG